MIAFFFFTTFSSLKKTEKLSQDNNNNNAAADLAQLEATLRQPDAVLEPGVLGVGVVFS